MLVRYPPHSVGLGPGAAVSLPGAPAGGHGELGFPAVDSAGRSVGAGWRNRPALPVLGLCQREGAPLAMCGLHRACRARRRSRYRETTPPWFPPSWPRSRVCRFRPWIRTRPSDSAEARAGHPLHPMIAGNATGHKQGRYYSDRRSDRRFLRIGHSRPPGETAKAVLSRSSPPPERAQPHSLAGASGSGGGCAPVV